MKQSFLSLIIVLSISCSTKIKQKEQVAETISVDTVAFETSDTIKIQLSKSKSLNKTTETSDTIIYVQLINKFYKFDDLYLALYYREDAEEPYLKLDEYALQAVETSRVIVPDSLAKAFLRTEKLDSILLFDKEQLLIDTLYRKNFEYYDDVLESLFVSSYHNSKNVTNTSVTISFHSNIKKMLSKSIPFKRDSVIMNRLSDQLKLNKRYMMDFGQLVTDNDTISYLSYLAYRTGENKVYLMKNNVLTDSIDTGYLITKMIPVPLASAEQQIYIGNYSKPDTDLYWYQLIGIDVKKGEFEIYAGNQMKVKNNQLQY